MNNPYEIDMDGTYEIDMDADEIVFNDKKRKYSDIEQILKKQISYKKAKECSNNTFYNPSRKRMFGL